MTRSSTGARLLALLAVGCLIATAPGCTRRKRSYLISPPEGIALDSTGRVARRFLNDSLSLAAMIGGASDQDTTLVNPYRMAGSGGQIYLVEVDQRVLCFDTAGALRWVRGGEGGGPGEFRNIRDMKIGPEGQIWLHDPAAARVTILRPDGSRARTISLIGVGHSETIAPLPGGRFVLLPAYAARDVVYLSATGDTTASGMLPWDGYAQLELLARGHQTAVDPATGHWVFGFRYGNGWFAFNQDSGHTSVRRFYAEPTSFPPVIREMLPDGSIGTKLVRTPVSGLDLALKGDTLFVLFGGVGDLRRRVLDLFSWNSGNYLGTLRLPEPAEIVSLFGNLLVTYSSDPRPTVRVYRRAELTGLGAATAAPQLSQ